MRAALVTGLLVVSCTGETIEVRLCPSPELSNDDGDVLTRVQVLRVGFQEIDGEEVVEERIVQGPASSFSAEGVLEEDAEVAIWADGLESTDAIRPVVTGSTSGPVRTDGVRPICICMAEPAHWTEQCRGIECNFEDGACHYR